MIMKYAKNTTEIYNSSIPQSARFDKDKFYKGPKIPPPTPNMEWAGVRQSLTMQASRTRFVSPVFSTPWPWPEKVAVESPAEMS